MAKACGSCTLCCKVMQVDPLAKPAGRWCVHVREGLGCGVYETRPGDCRTFRCEWLVSDRLGDEWKPDRCHFLMRGEADGARLVFDVDADHPEAWRREPYYSFIKQCSHAIRSGQGQVIVYVGDEAWLIFPEEDIAIGDIRGGQDLRAGYAREGRLVRPMVQVRQTDGTISTFAGRPAPGPA